MKITWKKFKRKWIRPMGDHGAAIVRAPERNRWWCYYGNVLAKEFSGTVAEAKAWMDENETKIVEKYKNASQELVI